MTGPRVRIGRFIIVWTLAAILVAITCWMIADYFWLIPADVRLPTK